MALMVNHIETGAWGEEIACRFLRGKGFSIIDRNFRKPWGEIDIIAEKGDVIHFVEVKSISQLSPSERGDISREMEYRPEEMVTDNKIHKIVRTASLYMEARGEGREYQIDAVGVLLNYAQKRAKCRFYEQIL